jgi:ribulose-5-phosphate 4-epimerase/fuculose-1-phosphate aldolase
MNNIPESQLTEFVEACRAAARHRLVQCSSGNLSRRIDEERMLVTASRSWMSRVTSDDVAVCSLEDGSVLRGKKPSVEIRFHAGILRTRPDVNVVLHFQSPMATTLACSRAGEINYFVIPEIPYYIGPVAHIPYLPPGSKELADAVIDAMGARDLGVMDHHGQVAVGSDYDQVIQNAVFFELACEILVCGGDAVKPLDHAAAKALMAAGQKDRGSV